MEKIEPILSGMDINTRSTYMATLHETLEILSAENGDKYDTAIELIETEMLDPRKAHIYGAHVNGGELAIKNIDGSTQNGLDQAILQQLEQKSMEFAVKLDRQQRNPISPENIMEVAGGIRDAIVGSEDGKKQGLLGRLTGVISNFATAKAALPPAKEENGQIINPILAGVEEANIELIGENTIIHEQMEVQRDTREHDDNNARRKQKDVIEKNENGKETPENVTADRMNSQKDTPAWELTDTQRAEYEKNTRKFFEKQNEEKKLQGALEDIGISQDQAKKTAESIEEKPKADVGGGDEIGF